MTEKRLGYRQRHALELLRKSGGEVPTGYLVRALGTDKKTVNMALQGLRHRGLADRPRHGHWRATVAA